MEYVNIFSRFNAIHECDRLTKGQMDRHRPMANTVLTHSVAW